MIRLTSPPRNSAYVGAKHAAPWFLWTLAIILFAAFALRLWNLDTQSLWHDEAWSVMSAYQPLTPIDPNYPPLFTVLLGVWIRLVGDSVWAMRYWSLLFGVATVAVMAIVARRWFGDRAAIIAAILIAVSPILWVFSQEIRSYVMVPVLALALLALTEIILRRGRIYPAPTITRCTWIWLALTEIILLYTHNLSVPIVAWLNVTVIAVLLFRRDWRRLRTWLLMQAGLLILYFPWLITQRPTGTPLNTPPTVSPALVWDIWQSYFTGIKAMVGAEPGLMALIAVFGVVGLVSMGVAVGAGFKPAPTTDPRKLRLLIVLSQAILIPIFEIIIILAAHIDFHPRYFIAGVPATLLLIAVGLDRLAQRGLLLRVAAVGATALAVGIGVYMARLVYGNPAYQHDDFRAIAQHYAQLGPDDAIIIPYGWEPTLDYYSRKMNFKAKLIGIPLHSDADTIFDQLRTGLQGVKRTELLTWYQLPADVRGAYPCLLGAWGVSSDTHTVAGLKTAAYMQSYFSERFRAAVLQNDTGDTSGLNFGPVDLVTKKGIVPGTNSCVITTWQLKERTSENLRVAVRLTTYDMVQEIAHTDSDLLDDQQLPTSFWNVGKIGTTFNLLERPVGLSIDVPFPVVVTIYSDRTPHGFDAWSNTGKMLGKNVAIDWPTFGYLGRDPRPMLESVQLTSSDLDFGGGIYLHRKDIPVERNLQQGQEIVATFEWFMIGTEQLESFRYTVSGLAPLSLVGDGWSTREEYVVPIQPRILCWPRLRVPASANGTARLIVTAINGRSMVLGEYDITPITRSLTEPAAANRVSATFAGVGTLIGYTSPDSIKSGEALPVTLYWKPNTTPSTALKVFVHLLAGKDYSNGIIAQSDAEPVGGQRPTTSWIAGEYITDQHTLTFNNPGYTGPAALSIGLYDPATGKRVLLENGDDHIVLPITITVK